MIDRLMEELEERLIRIFTIYSQEMHPIFFWDIVGRLMGEINGIFRESSLLKLLGFLLMMVWRGMLVNISKSWSKWSMIRYKII